MRALAIGVLSVLGLSGSAALALGDCPRPNADWIELEFEFTSDGPPSASDAQLQSRILEHLRAEFSAQSIEVCSARTTSALPPLATLRITRDAANAAEVRAWANDNVTHKELTRRLSLEGLPADAHALAIALGASELVSASWMELRLDSRREQRARAPESVQNVVAARESVRDDSVELAIRTATEAFTAGVQQFGFDAAIGVKLTEGIDAVVRVGARSALAVRAPHGSVSASGWLVGIGSSWTMAQPTPAVRLKLEVQSDLMWADFRALPNKGAVATTAGGNAWWLSGGVGSDIALTERAFLELGVQAGMVLIPLKATDAGREVTGIARGVMAGHAGIKIPL